jgi:hydroxypyruvate reductase
LRRTSYDLRRDALDIWLAGVAAVKSEPLVRRQVRVEGRKLAIGGKWIDLDRLGRIVVVGAGKAGAGMAAGLEAALGERVMSDTQLTGWVNVPADCTRPLRHIHLHAARPAGVNEPTPEGVAGAREIMRSVSALEPTDLCIALVSGGGSALLPLPVDGIALEDKLAVTRFLSASGAPIEELNTVRTHLSQIKGGGLARACRAGRMVTLVISDILADPLHLIASGPTVESRTTSDEALTILERYKAREAGISPRVFAALERREEPTPVRCRVTNMVIGNNAEAVEAARFMAGQLGYIATAAPPPPRNEGSAEEVGHQLAYTAARAHLAMRGTPRAECLISGGEPTVKLVDLARRGLGGRNQQLVLAAAEHLRADFPSGVVILSGGTDGEDGPTDAAGAWVDKEVIDRAAQLGLDPGDYLARNDAYHWFEPLGALVKTGPTDTNVCDVRVVLVQPG